VRIFVSAKLAALLAVSALPVPYGPFGGSSLNSNGWLRSY